MTEEALVALIRARVDGPKVGDEDEATHVCAPATEEALQAAEKRLGAPLPPTLRHLYTKIGNGGFGPGAGLLGVEGGHLNDDGESLVTNYVRFRNGGWPDGLLPLFDLGGGAWAGILLGAKEARVTLAVESGPISTAYLLGDWLAVWARGDDAVAELFEVESAVLRSPFSGEEVTYRRRGKPKRGL